jgi:hypothetical protein
LGRKNWMWMRHQLLLQLHRQRSLTYKHWVRLLHQLLLVHWRDLATHYTLNQLHGLLH